jgi:hypothetical protein
MPFTGSTDYPSGLDDFDTAKDDADPIGQDLVDVRAAVEAIEAELGTNPSGAESTVAAAIAASGGGSTWAELAVADGAVGAWLHDETSGTNSTDITANTNDGTYTGGVTLNQSVTGMGFTKAALFDGSNDYVTVPDHATLDLTTAVTLEAFIKPDSSVGGERAAVSKGGTSGYLMELNDTAVLGRFNGAGPNTGVTQRNAWSHIALSWENATGYWFLFINGVLTGTPSTAGGPIVAGSDPLLIGQYGGAAFYKGLIGPVAVYGAALGGNIIMRHYLAGIGAGVE